MSEEQEAPFKKGDAVQHRTGGPKMIYIGPASYGGALCSWMQGGKKQMESFEFEELQPYQESVVSGLSGGTNRG